VEVTMPLLASVLLALLASAATAAAQTTARPSPAVEFTGGYAGFADEGIVGHSMFGGAARFYFSPRIGVGPEVQYMMGSGSHRDLMLTGNLTFDLLSPTGRTPRRVTPFLVVGGGLFRTTDSAFGDSFSSSEGGFTGGGGVRAWINDRTYVASEVRVGWEPHLRVTGTVGVRLGRRG
jgi:hypothetical protein